LAGIDTALCVAGVILLIGATGVATLSIYDACYNRSTCDNLWQDIADACASLTAPAPGTTNTAPYPTEWAWPPASVPNVTILPLPPEAIKRPSTPTPVPSPTPQPERPRAPTPAPSPGAIPTMVPPPSPTPAPTPSPGQDVYLYHYTQIENIPSILTEGLRPSIKIPGDPSSDAQLGDGQYLTDLSPSDILSGTMFQTARALFNQPFYWGSRTRSDIGFIKIKVSGLAYRRVAPLFSKTFGDRSIYLVGGRENLPLVDRVSETGSVLFRPSSQDLGGG
jgi:hypothetical protein